MVLHRRLQGDFSALFVGPVFGNESIKECIFILSRGITIKNECTSGILFWLSPSFRFISKLVEPIVADIPIAWIPSMISSLRLLAVLLHLGTSFILLKSSRLVCSQNPKSDVSFIYGLNPIILLSCAMSPSPSLLHLLIALAHYSALRGYSILLSLSITLLVSGHSEFYCVIPAYLVLLRASMQKIRINDAIKKRLNYATCIWKIMCVSSFTAVVISLFLFIYHEESKTIGTTSLSRELYSIFAPYLSFAWTDSLAGDVGRYQPAAGPFWYLEAQVFDQFANYFSLLVRVQPFLFVVPLLVRLSHLKPLHTVCSFSNRYLLSIHIIYSTQVLTYFPSSISIPCYFQSVRR